MRAVIKTGGKQYRVEPGDVLEVEKLPGEAGDTVDFDRVLMLTDGNGDVKIGTPFLDGTVVKGKILGNVKGDKIIVYKFKRRKKYRRKQGHRQKYTKVEITDIES